MQTFTFERTASRKGIFRPPEMTWLLTDAQGNARIRLVAQGREGHYEDRLTGERFPLKKNFWGNAWYYADDTQRLLARCSFGWKTGLTVTDGSRYGLRILRKRWLTAPAIPGYHQAAFSNNDQVVFTLDNLHKRKWTESEQTALMKGNIHTDITEPAVIAAFLLCFQLRLEMDNRGAAA